MDSALLWATWNGDPAAVADALARGAQPTAVNAIGRTALHHAARHEDASMADVLIRGGAVVNATTQRGDGAPLHYAATYGRGACCRVLLSAGADVHAVSCVGDTPLHKAAFKGSVDCVAQLLAAGADVRQRNNCAESPVDAAVRRGRLAAVALLHHAAAAAARWSGLRRTVLIAWCAE